MLHLMLSLILRENNHKLCERDQPLGHHCHLLLDVPLLDVPARSLQLYHEPAAPGKTQQPLQEAAGAL